MANIYIEYYVYFSIMVYICKNLLERSIYCILLGKLRWMDQRWRSIEGRLERLLDYREVMMMNLSTYIFLVVVDCC